MAVPFSEICALLLILTLSNTSGHTIENCNRTINLESDKTSILESPTFPLQDSPGTSCIWHIYSPENTLIYVSCPTAIQPEETPCGGFFHVYHDSSQSTNKSVYCRGQPFSDYSVANRMSIMYDTNTKVDHGGWPFKCFLTVQKTDEPFFGRNECNCGKQNTARYFGGKEVRPHEYPMTVFIENERDFCGGTIIADDYILSAAHCFTEYSKDEDATFEKLSVFSEVHDIDKRSEYKVHKVKKIIRHPTYLEDFGYQNRDVALLQLVEPMQLNRKALPACLPFNNYENAFVGEDVFGLGWGLEPGDSLPNPHVLKKADLLVMNEAACKNLTLARYEFPHYLMCTFIKSAHPCTGDSGGPILWRDPVTFQLKLIGVIGRRYGNAASCGAPGNRPGINTRVTEIMYWIEETVGRNRFCRR